MRQAWSRPLLDPGGSYDERQITHLPRNLFISEIGGIAKRRKRPALLVITSVDTSAHSLREAASKQDLECGHLFLPVVADHHRRAPGDSAPVFCGQ